MWEGGWAVGVIRPSTKYQVTMLRVETAPSLTAIIAPGNGKIITKATEFFQLKLSREVDQRMAFLFYQNLRT